MAKNHGRRPSVRLVVFQLREWGGEEGDEGDEKKRKDEGGWKR